MVRKLLAASAAVLLVIGVTIAAKDKGDKSSDNDMVTGKFVKWNADKNEITVKTKSDEKTYMVAQDAKIQLSGDLKSLKDLKADDAVVLVLKKDGDKTIVVEVRQPKASGSPSPSQVSFVDKGSSSGSSSSSGTSSSSSSSS